MLWGDDGFGVFVKRVKIPEGVAEIKGLNLIRRLAGVRTPFRSAVSRSHRANCRHLRLNRNSRRAGGVLDGET